MACAQWTLNSELSTTYPDKLRKLLPRSDGAFSPMRRTTGGLLVEAGRFRVRVPCHPLRDFDTPAVREVVGNPGCAKGVAACGRY
jgi:hypothetical protein